MIRSIRNIDLRNQTVFLRLDLNVPLSEPNSEGIREVVDDNRIVEVIPTIQFALSQGANLVIASHLGRPGGKPDPQYSLEPVALKLAELLTDASENESEDPPEVMFADDCVGDGIELLVKGLARGQVLVLENLRFHSGEESNNTDFVNQLARHIDVYINDAFGTAHRKHASTYGLPSTIPRRGVGLLIEKELKFLNKILKEPQKPFYTILGGAKVSDKIKAIRALMRNVDGMIIGGAMAYAFDAAQGRPLPEGAKQPTPGDIAAAKDILKEAKQKSRQIVLPVDTVDAFDIGPKTLELFTEKVSIAKTIFWNGPLGWFEKSDYAAGTFGFAEKLAELSALKIVGGGDTVSAVKQSGFSEKFDHLSTGGGAVIKYLEGNGLPGIDVLQTSKNYRERTALVVPDIEEKKEE